jgi:hypothetical protein
MLPEGGSAAKVIIARPAPMVQRMTENRTRRREKPDSDGGVFFMAIGIFFVTRRPFRVPCFPLASEKNARMYA